MKPEGFLPLQAKRVLPVDLRAALVVAHPGHELRIFGWLEKVRPQVFILTDVSGHTTQGRLAGTAQILDQVGAPRGDIFGRLRDRELYSALLDGHLDVFLQLAAELADALARSGVDHVVSDAVEGYNPGHDVCSLLAQTAVGLIRRREQRHIEHFDFLLVGSPVDCPLDLRSQALWLELDEDALDRKLAAAATIPELAREVDAALRRSGRDAFRVECLRPAQPLVELTRFSQEPPFYETYGAQQVQAGHYARALRFQEHFAPLLEALKTFESGAVSGSKAA